MKLIEAHGTIAKLADAIDKAPAIVSQLKAGGSFGEKTARDIERALILPLGSMDYPGMNLPNGVDDLLNKIRDIVESQKLDLNEKILIKCFRALNDREKSSLLNMAKTIASKKT